MRVTNNFLISFAVLAFVFTVSLAWAFRGDLIPPLAAALDHFRIAVGLKQAPKMADKKGTEAFENQNNVQRSDIDQLVSELIGLEKSRRELNIKVSDLQDEIGVLQSEIEELEYVILEGKSEGENGELEQDLKAFGDDAGEEDLLGDESEPANGMAESQFYKDTNDQIVREYVDFYVDWLTDAQSVASQNQKAYICRNSNVSQFLAVNEDAALREACNITGYNRGITRNKVTGNQKSFLCRNLNVTRFLSAFKNVAASELCGE
jgi:TolA-binding protein